MFVRSNLLGKFRGCVERNIDGAGKPLLGLPENLRKLESRNLADDHEVDVALRKLLPACDGTVDERKGDFRFERFEKLPEHVHQSNGLRHQASQFIVERTIGVGLKIDAVSIEPSSKDAALNESRKRLLKSGWTAIQVPGQIAQIPPTTRAHHGRGQDALDGLRDQRIERANLTHNT